MFLLVLSLGVLNRPELIETGQTETLFFVRLSLVGLSISNTHLQALDQSSGPEVLGMRACMHTHTHIYVNNINTYQHSCACV